MAEKKEGREKNTITEQRSAHGIMQKYGVQHEFWGFFAEGRQRYVCNPILAAVGGRYGKSVAQVILRFLIQSDVIVIPKSTHRERMAENFNVFDFSLSEADMKTVASLDADKRAFFSHYDPATVEYLTGLVKR